MDTRASRLVFADTFSLQPILNLVEIDIKSDIKYISKRDMSLWFVCLVLAVFSFAESKYRCAHQAIVSVCVRVLLFTEHT